MIKEALKTYSLEEMLDKHIGTLGTPKREEFEIELRLDLLEEAIKIKEENEAEQQFKISRPVY